MKHKALISLMLCVVLLTSLAAPFAVADGVAVIGNVRVTSGGTVNVRSGPGTGYEIIAWAQPGDIYPCVGTSANGWYEIILDDGRHGFISGSLVSFTPYADNQPGTQQGGLRLPIYYKDVYGNLLATGYSYLSQGSTNIRPTPGMVPQGYQLLGPLEVTVSVDQYQRATPASVTFLYTLGQQQPQWPQWPQVTPQPQVTATLPVYYMTVFGQQLNTDYVTLFAGSNTIYPKQNLVGNAYILVGPVSAQVNVSAQGIANPGSIVFSYQPKPVATQAPVVVTPVLATGATTKVPIYYKDQADNVVFETFTMMYSNSQNYVVADDSLVPAGYELISPRRVYVGVNEKGHASPYAVNFRYRASSSSSPVASVGGGGVQHLPAYVKTRPNDGAHPVYTGPGGHYYRVGRATLGGGVIRVYGQENGWALIGYGLSNGGYRIGFVEMRAIPAGVQAPQLMLAAEPRSCHSSMFFVDDPIVAKNRELQRRFPAGTQFRLLAYLSDFWAYIELDNFDGTGQPARGFVPRKSFE